jgi:hypothetical protein
LLRPVVAAARAYTAASAGMGYKNGQLEAKAEVIKGDNFSQIFVS